MNGGNIQHSTLNAQRSTGAAGGDVRPTFAAVMITCPGREVMLQQTLASWNQTDFVGDETTDHGPPTTLLVQHDTNTHARKQERQEHNALAALRTALHVSPEAEFILFMEDDLLFNRHLRHNLERWRPLRNARTTDHGPRTTDHPAGGHFFASLYDCTIRELSRHDADHYFVADPEAVYGSQCFVLSAATARHCVAHWWEVPGMQDIKMSRLAARVCAIHYHTPSLVQHVGLVSAWGGRFHDTKDYDGEWRAANV